jgi:23S rRNA pseudouridine1911/1915/1917 synthase
MPPIHCELIVERESNGVRIDTFLERQLRNYTSWKLQRIVRGGGATIDHALAGETDRVYERQIVRIKLLEPPDKLLPPENRQVPILFEDPWVWVVDKPAGLIAHPAGEFPIGSLANILQHRLNQRTPMKGLMRPGIVHRLDRQTSGVMVVAMNYAAHRNLAMSFENGRVSKTYLAIVEGCIRNDDGVIDAPIGRSATGKQVLMSCLADALDRRPSRTHFKVIERFQRHTLVLARPMTGRNHQIRVHFAHLGHPLIGDEFYEAHGRVKPPRVRKTRVVSVDDGEEPEEADLATGFALRRHALHASRLEFAHPITGLWLHFESPLPDDFRETLGQLAERRSTPAAINMSNV